MKGTLGKSIGGDGKSCVRVRGGLGFQDVSAFNQALLAKQEWGILQSPSSLTSRVLKDEYFRNSTFLDVVIGKGISYLWHCILWGHEVIKKGIRRHIGDSLSTRAL